MKPMNPKERRQALIIFSKVIALIEPLKPEWRRRILNASLVLMENADVKLSSDLKK